MNHASKRFNSTDSITKILKKHIRLKDREAIIKQNFVAAPLSHPRNTEFNFPSDKISMFSSLHLINHQRYFSGFAQLLFYNSTKTHIMRKKTPETPTW